MTEKAPSQLEKLGTSQNSRKIPINRSSQGSLFEVLTGKGGELLGKVNGRCQNKLDLIIIKTKPCQFIDTLEALDLEDEKAMIENDYIVAKHIGEDTDKGKFVLLDGNGKVVEIEGIKYFKRYHLPDEDQVLNQYIELTHEKIIVNKTATESIFTNYLFNTEDGTFAQIP